MLTHTHRAATPHSFFPARSRAQPILPQALDGSESEVLTLSVLVIAKHVADDDRVTLICWDEDWRAPEAEENELTGGYQVLALQGLPSDEASTSLIKQLMSGLPDCPRAFDTTELAMVDDDSNVPLSTVTLPLEMTGPFVLVHEHVVRMLPDPSEQQAASLVCVCSNAETDGGICQLTLHGASLKVTQLRRRQSAKYPPVTFAQPSDDGPQLRAKKHLSPGVLTAKGSEEILKFMGFLYVALQKPAGSWVIPKPSLRLQFRRRSGLMPVHTAGLETPATVLAA